MGSGGSRDDAESRTQQSAGIGRRRRSGDPDRGSARRRDRRIPWFTRQAPDLRGERALSLELTLTAVVVGAALACALLGLQAPPAGMFAGWLAEPGLIQQAEPALVVPQQHKEATPAGHTDRHTGPKSLSVYLNQRLIDGESTRICTTAPGLHAVLVEADEIWNAELSALTTLSGNRPLIAHHSLRGIVTSDYSDSLFDIDVVLLKGTCPEGGAACHLRDSTPDPPRKEFTYATRRLRLTAERPRTRAPRIHPLRGRATILSQSRHSCTNSAASSVSRTTTRMRTSGAIPIGRRAWSSRGCGSIGRPHFADAQQPECELPSSRRDHRAGPARLLRVVPGGADYGRAPGRQRIVGHRQSLPFTQFWGLIA